MSADRTPEFVARPADPLTFRQSRIRAYHECPRRTVLELPWDAGMVGESADLGSALHAVVAECLRTMKRQDQSQIPTQEAVEIMYEVLVAGPWVLSPESHDWLRQMVLSFCALTIRPERILGIEQRLTADIVCPDGKVRTLTGQPDLLVADPGRPPGVVIEDFKSGLARPRTPREMPPEGEPIRGEEYLHEGGHTQLRIYGLLAMRNYPRVQRATLSQRNLRWAGPPREATIGRDDCEHIERQVGLLMMQLDLALTNGEGHPLSRPRPGPWCTTRCPVARSCPIPKESRGLGALETAEDAIAEAARFVQINALSKQMRAALKARHEATGEPIPVGDEILAWHAKPGGGREFAVKAVA